MSWTDEKVAKLKELWGKGSTASQIAEIIGGISRIGNVTGYLAPIMALAYVLCASIIIISNLNKIPDSFNLIITMAFNPPATIAGTGGGILMTMLWGIKRGLYSNEAGQGSAAIAHSTAKTKYPIREGAVAMLGPYIDTLIICTMTGLVIISTGAWKSTEFFVNIDAKTISEAKFAIDNGTTDLDLMSENIKKGSLKCSKNPSKSTLGSTLSHLNTTLLYTGVLSVW